MAIYNEFMFKILKMHRDNWCRNIRNYLKAIY